MANMKTPEYYCYMYQSCIVNLDLSNCLVQEGPGEHCRALNSFMNSLIDEVIDE